MVAEPTAVRRRQDVEALEVGVDVLVAGSGLRGAVRLGEGEGLVGSDEGESLTGGFVISAVDLDELVVGEARKEERVEDLHVGPFTGGERADRPAEQSGLDAAGHLVPEAGVIQLVTEKGWVPGGAASGS